MGGYEIFSIMFFVIGGIILFLVIMYFLKPNQIQSGEAVSLKVLGSTGYLSASNPNPTDVGASDINKILIVPPVVSVTGEAKKMWTIKSVSGSSIINYGDEVYISLNEHRLSSIYGLIILENSTVTSVPIKFKIIGGTGPVKSGVDVNIADGAFMLGDFIDAKDIKYITDKFPKKDIEVRIPNDAVKIASFVALVSSPTWRLS